MVEHCPVPILEAECVPEMLDDFAGGPLKWIDLSLHAEGVQHGRCLSGGAGSDSAARDIVHSFPRNAVKR